MHQAAKEKEPSKLSFMWIVGLIIILIKSDIVLFSLFGLHWLIIINSILTVVPILFLISFSFIFSQKGQLIYLFILDLVISALFIADMVYARAYGHLIGIHMMFAKDVMQGLSASVISLIKWTDFLMLVDLPILLFLALKSGQKERDKKRLRLFYITVILSILTICFQFVRFEKTKVLGNSKVQPMVMSPIGTHMFDLYSLVYEKVSKLDNEDKAVIAGWLEENSKYQEPDEKYSYLEGTFKGKNIIAVQVESLENILVNQSFGGKEITPNINKLLGHSIYFNNIHEQVRDGNSSDAEFMFNTSVYPLGNGSAFLRFGGNKYVALPQLLHEQGYTSIALHGDNKEFWNRDQVFPSLGFEKFISEDEFADKSSDGMGILDKSLFSQTISEIKKLKEPYYSFVITITSHMPFKINKNIQYLDLPFEDDTSRYLQSIYYVDKVFGEFYSQMEKEGILDNAVLVLYGDHEGIHKYYSTTLPDNNYEIPFIIHVPGMKGQVIDKVGGQVDMMPTLAYLLGIEKEKILPGVMGRNLFGKSPGTVILPNDKIIGEDKDKEHLTNASTVSDLIIRGNYFNLR